MLSGLAFTDWAALLVAFVLLGITGVATYLSHIAGADVADAAHGATGKEDLYEGLYSVPPAHAATGPRPPMSVAQELLGLSLIHI